MTISTSSPRLVRGLAKPSTAIKLLHVPHPLNRSSQRKKAERLHSTYIKAAAAESLPSDAEVVPVLALPSADERYSGMRVLIAGAGGGTGRAAVSQLAEMGIPVRAMVRDAVKSSPLLPSADRGVEILEGDVYKYQDVVRAVKGCNAIIIATGPTDRLNPLAPFQVDFVGNQNIVAAALKQGVKKIVLVSSIGTDDPLFPLNLFWGVLLWKKQGELVIQRSGVDYTIIRPGGLLNEPRSGQKEGGVIIASADAFGLPPRRRPGSILRRQVADCCVSSLVESAASNKVVEIIAESGESQKPWVELFESVP